MSILNIHSIMSDPLLMIAAVFLIVGPLVFLIALVQFIRSGKKSTPIELIDEPADAPQPLIENPVQKNEPDVLQELPPMPIMDEEPAAEPPPPPAPSIPVIEEREEKTVVMPAGFGEVQGQIEIAFSQIKSLNKKTAQLESELESLSRSAVTRLEKNDLKELPTNPADFMVKLLKLAEHVIVLEKEVARLKSKLPEPTNGNQESSKMEPVMAPTSPTPSQRPPIMPI